MKAHKLNIRIICIFTLGIFLLSPQIHSQSFLSFDSIAANLQKQKELSPQEKIYVHTDKPHYVCGEKIWFRAYLMDAFTHRTAQGSKYVYAELIAPEGKVATRVKIKERDSIFAGYIQLTDTLPEGNYTLCAYTSLMCGSSQEYFFKKNIYISNPLQKTMRAEATFEQDGNRTKATLRFTDLYKNKRIKPYRIYVTQGTDTLDFKWNDKDTTCQASLRTPEKPEQRILTVRAGNFRQYIAMPDQEKEFDVAFFPEGGYLIPDRLCRVGFKALASDGWATDIKGELYDNENRLITTFSPYYKGMGDLYFRPQRGKAYYALCKDETGRAKRFELPQTNPDACVLKVVQDKREITVGLLHADFSQRGKPTLVAHARGEIVYAAEWNGKKDCIRFKKKIFPEGIVQFLLLDEKGNPLSERIIFCRNDEKTKTEVYTDRKEYGTREPVTVKVKLRDNANKPVKGSVSVSVTDNGVVRRDTCTSIHSSLLLASELRGNIEDPAFYFKKDSRLASAALDALMLTQGWRRYELPEVIKGHFAEPESTLEIGQEIAGTVLSSLRHRPLSGGQVAMASLDKKFADIALTDKQGRFCFKGFEFADSTAFFVRALGKRESEYVELKMDKDLFPKTTPANIRKEWFPAMLDDYTNKTANKISMENGIRHIWLDEVVKTAPRKLPPVKDILASHIYSQEYIKERNLTTLMELLRRIPGLKITNTVKTINENAQANSSSTLKGIKFDRLPLFRETVRFASAKCPLLVVIDNIPMNDPYFAEEEFDYSSIIFMDVDHVNVYRPGESAIFGFKGAGGVIDITTKKAEDYDKIELNNKTILHPLGYQKHAAFYSPRYTTKEPIKNTDLRTTIYWNPNVKLTNTGEATFDFYTADFDTDYFINLEGVNHGEIEQQDIIIEIKHEE